MKYRDNLLNSKPFESERSDYTESNLPNVTENDSSINQIIAENERLKRQISDLKQQNLTLNNILKTNMDK